MRRAIGKLLRAEIAVKHLPCLRGGHDRLSRADLDAMTEDVVAMLMRSPRYTRLPLRFLLGFVALFVNIEKHLRRFRAGDVLLPIRSLCRKLAFDVMVPIQIAVHSAKRVLELQGIVDSGIKFIKPGPNIHISQKFPEIVRTVEARKLRSKAVYDVIIVGSGPGGAVAAQVLSEEGFSVLVCEKGGTATPNVTNFVGAARRYYSYGGQLVAFGAGLHGVPVLTAEMVGGSAVVNMGSCPEPSERVMRKLGCGDPFLRAYFELAKEKLHVQPADQKLAGRQNRLLAEACKKAGVSWEFIPRNAMNGSGAAAENIFGGVNSLKISPDRGALREAVSHGAVVARRADVRRLVIKHGRAVGVIAACQGKQKTFFAREAVIVAGGSIQTPLLLKRSGVAHAGVGRASFFQVNASAFGRMAENVKSGRGTEQCVLSRNLEDIGLVIEAVSLPAALIAPYLPGDTEARWEQLRQYDRLAAFGFIADCMQTPVTVDTLLGDPYITFDLHHDDADLIRQGFAECAKLLFEARATEVLIPGLNRWHASVSEIEDALKALPDDELAVASVHLVGTCPMGEDEAAPVDPKGRVRDVEGLYVADGSVIPTALGVNPQLTIAALSLRTAVAIARDAKEK